jgi:hypothetical protein
VNDFRKKIAFMLLVILLDVLVLSACVGPSIREVKAQPAWPTTWISIDTDPNEAGVSDHRDVTATFYALSSGFLFLRMQTVDDAGWPSTDP